MSVQRVVTPLAMPSNFFFLRLSSLPATSAARPCQHVLRTFSSARTLPPSKRKMQTSTAYQPYTFEAPPLPLRNSGTPDTSIAGSIPQVNETRPPKQAAEEMASISLTEQEAQKSQSLQTQARPRSKLRARKAPMTLTPKAVAQLRKMMDGPSPKLIKVGVKNKGCSGMSYNLEYVDKAGALDEVVEQDGVKVLIDNRALLSVIGSEMDWVRDKLSQKFVFKNPNIKESCGCGESFMI
jgi:iron-sulfur cluster assembly accessory protein